MQTRTFDLLSSLRAQNGVGLSGFPHGHPELQYDNVLSFGDFNARGAPEFDCAGLDAWFAVKTLLSVMACPVWSRMIYEDRLSPKGHISTLHFEGDE
jgi:hypothetical protein